MSLTNKETGKLGEELAERFLTARGLYVHERNFSTPFGEIDIIAKDGDFIVFFEVKTRISDRFGSPLYSITREKKEHVLKNCRFYIKRCGLHGKPCRVDVIAINLDRNKRLKVLRHVKNAITLNEGGKC